MTWYKLHDYPKEVRRENQLRSKGVMWLLFGMIYLAACTTTPTSTATEVPTAVPTAVPTQPTSSATITMCDPAKFIDHLREVVPYEESIVSYNHFNDTANLTAWFVDPVLDPQASDFEAQALAEVTFRHSVEIAHLLAKTEPCVTALFDSVTVIAVDHLYYAWYVGAVPAWQIPISEELSEEERSKLEENFDAGYQRTEKVLEGDLPEVPEGSCSWPEARQSMQQAFTQSQRNLAVYYYIEPNDASVYVQWEIPSAATNSQQILDYFFLPLPYIDRAVSCLYPEFDTLWLFYVRQDGEAQWVFALDGDAVREDDHQVFIDSLELMYQTTVE